MATSPTANQTVGPLSRGRMRKCEKSMLNTYRITNLRGFSERTGKRVKQMTKQARAARLQAPKISRRSQRLTAKEVSRCYPRHGASASHAASKAWLEHNAHVPLQGCRAHVIGS